MATEEAAVELEALATKADEVLIGVRAFDVPTRETAPDTATKRAGRYRVYAAHERIKDAATLIGAEVKRQEAALTEWLDKITAA